MASETNTDKIAKLEKLTAVIEERVDREIELLNRVESDLIREINSVGVRTNEMAGRLPIVEKDLALVGRDVQKLEKRVDEVLTHRWELWKLILAAFLGSLLTVAAGWANKSLEQLIDSGRLQPIPSKTASPRR